MGCLNSMALTSTTEIAHVANLVLLFKILESHIGGRGCLRNLKGTKLEVDFQKK